MTRNAIRVFLLLLLGAIVNIAVAWGLAIAFGRDDEVGSRMNSRPTVFVDRHAVPARLLDNAYWPPPSTVAKIASHTFSTPGFEQVWYEPWQEIDLPGLAGTSKARTLFVNTNDYSRLVVVCVGWPAHSMRDLVVHPRAHRTASHQCGWRVAKAIASDLYLPLRPIWPGFAVNTVFYAAVLWFLWMTPFAVRRWWGGRRIRRGLCPKCGYDLRGSPPHADACPECGARLESP